MKKLMIFGMGMLMVAGAAFAQSADNTDSPARGRDSVRQRMSTEQKAQLITDRMAKAYDLTQDQKTKLLDLNTRTLRQNRQRFRPYRPDFRNRRPDSLDRRPGFNQNAPKSGERRPQMDKRRDGKDSLKGFKPQGAPRFGGPGNGRNDLSGGQGGRNSGNGYNRALRQILTPEQFQAYRTDRAIFSQINPTEALRPGAFPGRGWQGRMMRGCPNQPRPYCDPQGQACVPQGQACVPQGQACAPQQACCAPQGNGPQFRPGEPVQPKGDKPNKKAKKNKKDKNKK